MTTSNNTKASVLSKLASVDSMTSKSSQAGKEESILSTNHHRPSPRQKKKKKKSRHPGSRDLKMADITDNKDIEKKPSLEAKDVVTGYSQIKLQDRKDGEDRSDQKNKKEDVKKVGKDGQLFSDEKSKLGKKANDQSASPSHLLPDPGARDAILQKLRIHGSTNKTGNRSKQQLAQKGNLTATKKPDDICQGKLCVPAYALLIEEGLPNNITLKQVNCVYVFVHILLPNWIFTKLVHALGGKQTEGSV